MMKHLAYTTILLSSILLSSCTHTKTQSTEDLVEIYKVCEKEKGVEKETTHKDCLGKAVLELTVHKLAEQVFEVRDKKYTEEEAQRSRKFFLEIISSDLDSHLCYFDNAKITDKKEINKIIDEEVRIEIERENNTPLMKFINSINNTKVKNDDEKN